MAMTVEEALQQAEKLREQGCITPTAQALLALTKELQFIRTEHQVLATKYEDLDLEFRCFRSQYDGSA